MAAYIDPDDWKFSFAFEDGVMHHVPVSRLGLPRGPKVVYAAVDATGYGVDFVRIDGTQTDCCGDVLQSLLTTRKGKQ